jgi:hypothetical protein
LLVDDDGITSNNITYCNNGENFDLSRIECEENYWTIEANLFGEPELVSTDEDNMSRLQIDVDKNGNIISLSGEEMSTLELANEELTKIANAYFHYKDRYENKDEFLEEFLTSIYTGSTTWGTIIDNVFDTDREITIEPKDYYKDEENVIEGYKITISGTYWPNPVDLRGVLSETGSVEILVDSNDVSNCSIMNYDDNGVFDAIQVYIILGSNLYTY